MLCAPKSVAWLSWGNIGGSCKVDMTSIQEANIIIISICVDSDYLCYKEQIMCYKTII